MIRKKSDLAALCVFIAVGVWGLGTSAAQSVTQVEDGLDPPQVTARADCIIERITYWSDKLRIVGWIMRPKGEGRFPVLVKNHGSKDAKTVNKPSLRPDAPCGPLVKRRKMVISIPRGVDMADRMAAVS